MRIRCLRSRYHSQTSLGLFANASGVASFAGSRFRQYPSLPRKVGIPLSAETPAPVMTSTRINEMAKHEDEYCRASASLANFGSESPLRAADSTSHSHP